MNGNREVVKMFVIGGILGLVAGCDVGDMFLMAMFAVAMKVGMDLAWPDAATSSSTR